MSILESERRRKWEGNNTLQEIYSYSYTAAYIARVKQEETPGDLGYESQPVSSNKCTFTRSTYEGTGEIIEAS